MPSIIPHFIQRPDLKKVHVIMQCGSLCVLLLLFAVGAIRSVSGSFVLTSQYDFNMYYNAGKALNSQTPLYTTQGYIYPPAVAVMFRLFALLPRYIANIVWFAGNLGILLGTAGMIGRLALLSHRFQLLAVFLIMLLAPPTINTLILGQVNIILCGLLTATACLICADPPSSRHENVLGVLLGIAAMLKVYPVIFAGVLILARCRKALTAMALTLVVLGGIGMVAGGGWESTRYYFFELLPHLSDNISFFPDNQSVRAVVARLFSAQELRFPLLSDETFVRLSPIIGSPLLQQVMGPLILGAVSIITGVCIWRWRLYESQERFLWGYAFVLVTIFLVIPVVWDHYLVLLFLPAAVMWRQAALRPVFGYYGLIIGLFLGLHRFWRLLTIVGLSPCLMMSGFLATLLMWISLVILSNQRITAYKNRDI